MKIKDLVTFIVLFLLLSSCQPMASEAIAAPVSTVAAAQMETPKEPQICKVGQILDSSNETTPDFCEIMSFGRYQLILKATDRGLSTARIYVQDAAFGTFEFLGFLPYTSDEYTSTVTLLGMTGTLTVTLERDRSDSDLQKITEIVINYYSPFDVSACEGKYLLRVDAELTSRKMLYPVIESNALIDGSIWVNVNPSTVNFFTYSSSADDFPLADLAIPKNYLDKTSASFKDGTDNVSATVTNCGGNMLGVTYTSP